VNDTRLRSSTEQSHLCVYNRCGQHSAVIKWLLLAKLYHVN